MDNNETLTYTVPGMTCGHCEAAVTEEVTRVEGVTAVEVDLESKRVMAAGDAVDDGKVREAIDEAGYEAV